MTSDFANPDMSELLKLRHDSMPVQGGRYVQLVAR